MTTDPRSNLSAALADRYRIERELGRGGMAVVYLADDLRHDRPVALKVLNPELAQALGSERFEREIRTAARLQHPHILTVLDSGASAGFLWFTMPFVEGESLRARLDRERQLSVENAVRIAREAADALDYAHRHGIVHRDIKPDNILLTDDHALVADFGIARALAGGGENLTATGASIGTAAYMSPEQAAGERDVDARSDIFSLGIVLYEMLAGTTPFAAATPQATIARRFTEDAAPVRKARASVPEHIERALQQALARTAADRFPTARAFADALSAAPIAATTVATPVELPAVDRSMLARARRTPAYLALAVGLLIGVGALFAWSRGADGGDATANLRAGSAETSSIRIAVLPFENLGDTADAYFADGVTDAVRGKLAEIKGIEVIARASSQEYQGTTKPPAQIADELGVQILLTGTVRWVRQPDGTSRVQVRPELVEIGDGTAQTRWTEAFNAPLTDVFEVQEQISGRVSGALDVALGTADRERLAEHPTDDLEAYGLYLQAEANPAADPAGLRASIALLERAVQGDSTFGLAWARLAGTIATLAGISGIPPSPDAAERALERATALAPEAPETYRARISVAANLERDMPRAMAIGNEALGRFPNDATILRTLGSLTSLNGNPEAALPLLQRAATLDPRNVTTLRVLAGVLLRAGRFEESRDPFRRALALAPGSIGTSAFLVMSWIGDGDLAGARRTLNALEPPGKRAELLAFMANFGDFYWVLDAAQQDTVMRLGVEAFDGDEGGRALVSAQILHSRGDAAGASRFAAAAARHLERSVGAEPDGQLDALIGLSYALQGRHEDARRWFARARAVADDTTQSRDIRGYPYELMARASMIAGDHEAALAAMGPWLKQTPAASGRARIHPEFAPLRGNPRFESLTARRRPG